jgi:predicted Zn-dependent peptidase
LRAVGKILLLIIAVALIPTWALAYDLKGHVEEFKLKNGMRWLIVKRGEAPVFTGVVMLRVGGADEERGKTGVAHMFEHMAFKGSSRLGTKDWEKEKPILDEIERIGAELTSLETSKSPDKKEIARFKKEMAAARRKAAQYQIRNEVWEVLMRNGAADLNAYTSKDITTYHASLPENRLELWARVTAEMVFDPAFREFYLERSVVAEERRTAVENNPAGALVEKLLASAYSGGPYSWSTIGFEDDIEGLTIGDAREFHAKHYVPSNMVGVIVGDVSPSKVKRIVSKAFGSYPGTEAPAGPEKKNGALGNSYVKMRFNAEPSLAIAYHKPTLPDKREYVFDVISALLCDGRSSWLEKRLIYDGKLAKDVYCSVGFPGSRFDNLFLIWVEPIKGQSLKRIIGAVEGELARLKTSDVSESDLRRVRKQVTSSIMFALDGNDKLAEALARFETIFGDWKLLADYPKNVEDVGAEDVRKVALEYLNPDNRVIVERSR